MGRILSLILVAGMAAYAQHGHGGGGFAGASRMPSDSSSAPSGMHGNAGAMDRNAVSGYAGHQSPETILQRDTKLSSKLDGLLPAGSNAQQACSGFKNLGGCVSAIHVSHNLGIPFGNLKARLTGTTPEKLGQAIHDMKPGVDGKVEAKKAQKQATRDLGEASE